jgi:hypothetical protein
VLVDTTRCIGCRSCGWPAARRTGCWCPTWRRTWRSEAHHERSSGRWSTAIRPKGGVVKKQCTAGSPHAAAYHQRHVQDPGGPVIWKADKCMAAAIAWCLALQHRSSSTTSGTTSRSAPCAMKDQGGEARLRRGLPGGGSCSKKRDLMEIARVRIYNHPSNMCATSTGSRKGGTGWLYLARSFEQRVPRPLRTTPYPEYTRSSSTGFHLDFGHPPVIG